MDIFQSTRKYERWLGKRTRLVRPDLEVKHKEMAKDPFAFFRATCYRWGQLWTGLDLHHDAAPVVLSVCDLHVENFGTWRDADGRMVWGVNDFDEACPLPYTWDLVRLAASALLAIAESRLAIDAKAGAEAILRGYEAGLSQGGRPFVLEENHGWLRRLVTGELRDPAEFWKKWSGWETVNGDVPRGAVKALEAMLPERQIAYRIVHRRSGLGSLGRQRWAAIGEWDGGWIAREAKALVPPSPAWCGLAPERIRCAELLDAAVRCRDPWTAVRGRWVVRRLAPHCIRVELGDVPQGQGHELELLEAMGFETANIHLGTPKAAKRIQKHLASRPADWLERAARKMGAAVIRDFEAWRSQPGGSS